MRGHPSTDNRRHAIRVAAEKGIPFVPFKPDEFKDWTVADIEALPVLNRLTEVPAGWEVIGHDWNLPKTDTNVVYLNIWANDIESFIRKTDAAGDVVGVMLDGDREAIHFLKKLPVTAVVYDEVEKIDRALFEQREQDYVAAGFKVEEHTAALKDGE